jgi:hypothetical protein
LASLAFPFHTLKCACIRTRIPTHAQATNHYTTDRHRHTPTHTQTTHSHACARTRAGMHTHTHTRSLFLPICILTSIKICYNKYRLRTNVCPQRTDALPWPHRRAGFAALRPPCSLSGSFSIGIRISRREPELREVLVTFRAGGRFWNPFPFTCTVSRTFIPACRVHNVPQYPALRTLRLPASLLHNQH